MIERVVDYVIRLRQDYVVLLPLHPIYSHSAHEAACTLCDRAATPCLF